MGFHSSILCCMMGTGKAPVVVWFIQNSKKMTSLVAQTDTLTSKKTCLNTVCHYGAQREKGGKLHMALKRKRQFF